MSKKLLSVLVVLALALSMIPVVGLPAAEANAASDVNKNLSFKSDGKTAYCPHCDKDVEWTDVCTTKEKRIGYRSSNKGHEHYYLSGPLTGCETGRFVEISSGTFVCFHLNGNDMTYGAPMVVGGGTLNVMGNGKVTYLKTHSTDANIAYAMTATGGDANIYGGTWMLGTDVSATIQVGRRNLTLSGKANIGIKITANTAYKDEDEPASTLILKQGAIAEQLEIKDGVLKIDGSWTGTANLVNEKVTYPNWSATGKYTGALTLDTDGVGTGTTRGRIVTNDGSTLIIGRAIIGETWYSTLGAAVTAYTAADFTNGKVIKSYCAAGSALPTVAGQSYYIDLNGFNATKVSGAGTVYLLDSANDTYDATKCGQATIEEGSTVTIKEDATVGGKRYLTLKDATSGAHTAHLLTIDITDAVLRTSENGLLFKAKIGADEVLGAMIKSCGVVVSNTDAPTAVVEAHNAFTKLDFTPNSKGIVYTNSALVKNIFKDAADATNKTRSETKIYAKAYVTLQKDATSEPVEMFGEGVSASAADILKAIDTKWSSYNAKAQANAKSFFAQWKGKGASGNRIEDLGLTNIK